MGSHAWPYALASESDQVGTDGGTVRGLWEADEAIGVEVLLAWAKEQD